MKYIVLFSLLSFIFLVGCTDVTVMVMEQCFPESLEYSNIYEIKETVKMDMQNIMPEKDYRYSIKDNCIIVYEELQ